MALLVIRSRDDSASHSLQGLNQYLVSEQQASEWPGTHLLPLMGRTQTGTVLTYSYSAAVASILGDLADGLYQWLSPELPEDLALLREPDNVWLASVAHEADGWLELTMDEHAVLLSRVPGLEDYIGSGRVTGREVPGS